MNMVWVAIGGAIGAVCRYGISLVPLHIEFPFLTLVTNSIGAIVMGIVVGLACRNELISPEMVLFWKTGVCGGFTTFSTFSLEVHNLFSHNQHIMGMLYIVLSVLCCVLGIWIGKKIAVCIPG